MKIVGWIFVTFPILAVLFGMVMATSLERVATSVAYAVLLTAIILLGVYLITKQ